MTVDYKQLQYLLCSSAQYCNAVAVFMSLHVCAGRQWQLCHRCDKSASEHTTVAHQNL